MQRTSQADMNTHTSNIYIYSYIFINIRTYRIRFIAICINLNMLRYGHFIAAHTNNNCHNLYLKYEVLNVHRALSDIYLPCSKRACPTLLDS